MPVKTVNRNKRQQSHPKKITPTMSEQELWSVSDELMESIVNQPREINSRLSTLGDRLEKAARAPKDGSGRRMKARR